MIKYPIGEYKVPVINLKATGQNIEKLRTAAGISVRELQAVMGFTNPQAIYKWQKGLSLPSIDNLIILADVLDVTIDEILAYDEDLGDDMLTFNIHQLCLHSENRIVTHLDYQSRIWFLSPTAVQHPVSVNV